MSSSIQGNVPTFFIITFEISKVPMLLGSTTVLTLGSCVLTYCGSCFIYRWYYHKTKSFIFSSRNSHVVWVTNIWSWIVGHIWRRIQNSFIMILIISLAMDMYSGFQTSGMWNCINGQVLPYISTHALYHSPRHSTTSKHTRIITCINVETSNLISDVNNVIKTFVHINSLLLTIYQHLIHKHICKFKNLGLCSARPVTRH